jgi:hypothetical protein
MNKIEPFAVGVIERSELAKNERVWIHICHSNEDAQQFINEVILDCKEDDVEVLDLVAVPFVWADIQYQSNPPMTFPKGEH